MQIPYGHIFLGCDYSVPPYELPLIALADAQNIVPDEKGLPTGRGGTVKLNSTSLGTVVTSFHEYRSGTSTGKVCSYSTKIAVYNSATGDFVTKITGLTDGAMFQWVNFAGKAIGVNAEDTPQYWTDDTHLGDLTGSPAGAVTVAEWSNRIWFGGYDDNVAVLVGSALNDPTDYTTTGATGYVSQTIGDSGDPITGIFGFFDILLIGKRNTLYKVTGAPTTSASALTIKPVYTKEADSVGFTSKWAITQVGNDVIFLDGFDIKRLSGIQEFGDLETTSIIPHFRDYLKSIGDEDYLQYTQFFHYKKKQQIWVSLPTSSTTRFVFCLDYRFKPDTGRYAFYPMSGMEVNCFGGILNGEVTDMYFGDRTGFVWLADYGDNDDADSIERFFTFCFHGNDKYKKNAHNYRKEFRESETFITPTETTLTMTPYYAINLMDDEQIRDEDNYTALSAETVSDWTGTGTRRKRVGLLGLAGNTLCLKWVHNTVAQNFSFYPSNLYATLKSRVIM